MKSYATYILVSLLLLSIFLNIYHFTKPAEDPSLETPPVTTAAPPETTAPPEEKLNLVELYEMNAYISFVFKNLRTGTSMLREEDFRTKESYQQVYALVRDFDSCHVDETGWTIEVSIINLTQEKIDTFLLLFGHEEYFAFKNDVTKRPLPGTLDPADNT